jgi:hypothetical protein
MSQYSEERAAAPSQQNPASAQSAQIIPFERPQSDLQKAVQQRAQEAMDLDRARAGKPNPLRWLIVFALATIPVILLLGAVDGFLRAYYRVNQMISEQVNAQPAPPPPEAPTQTEPGVVILQSMPDTQADTAAKSGDE